MVDRAKSPKSSKNTPLRKSPNVASSVSIDSSKTKIMKVTREGPDDTAVGTNYPTGGAVVKETKIPALHVFDAAKEGAKQQGKISNPLKDSKTVEEENLEDQVTKEESPEMDPDFKSLEQLTKENVISPEKIEESLEQVLKEISPSLEEKDLSFLAESKKIVETSSKPEHQLKIESSFYPPQIEEPWKEIKGGIFSPFPKKEFYFHGSLSFPELLDQSDVIITTYVVMEHPLFRKLKELTIFTTNDDYVSHPIDLIRSGSFFSTILSDAITFVIKHLGDLSTRIDFFKAPYYGFLKIEKNETQKFILAISPILYLRQKTSYFILPILKIPTDLIPEHNSILKSILPIEAFILISTDILFV